MKLFRTLSLVAVTGLMVFGMMSVAHAATDTRGTSQVCGGKECGCNKEGKSCEGKKDCTCDGKKDGKCEKDKDGKCGCDKK